MNIKSLFVLLIIFFFSPLASALSPVHIDPAGGCGILDVNGGEVITQDTAINDTKSRAKVRTLKCETDLATLPPDGGAITYNYDNTGFPCLITTDTGGVFTDKWHETISADGHVTLHCVYVMPPS